MLRLDPRAYICRRVDCKNGHPHSIVRVTIDSLSVGDGADYRPPGKPVVWPLNPLSSLWDGSTQMPWYFSQEP